MLKDQDKIKELFSEKLGNFQAPVNPELWTSIASQIGATSAVATTGTSVLVKAIIGVAAAGIVAVGTYFAINSTEESANSKADGQVSQNEITLDSSSEDLNNSEKADNYEPVSKEMNGKSSFPLKGEQRTTEEDKNEKVLLSESNKGVENHSSAEQIAKNPLITNVGPNNSGKNSTGSKEDEVIIKNENKSTTGIKEENKIPPVISDIKTPKKPLAEISETPDVFTPNGDNANDELFINYSGELVDFSLVVLNMNNTTVFETKDPNFKWRGEMMNGELAPNGSYVYIIIARDANGTPINKYQRLTITR